MKRKIFYYENEHTDDFGGTVKHLKPLPAKYVYARKDPFSRLLSFFLYRVIARPAVWAYMKIRFRHRFVGKKALAAHKGGVFVYQNHVLLAGDAFLPHLLGARRRGFVLTGQETSSLTALLPLLRTLGNIPLGQSTAQSVAMLKCMRQRMGEGASITVYPEAHVWLYYTGIRPFGAESFYYAVMLKAPVFCATTCFQKRRFFKTPRAVTFIDGPFYPQEGLTRAQSARTLRDKCYETMCARAAAHSDYTAYEYRKKERNDGENAT